MRLLLSLLLLLSSVGLANSCECNESKSIQIEVGKKYEVRDSKHRFILEEGHGVIKFVQIIYRFDATLLGIIHYCDGTERDRRYNIKGFFYGPHAPDARDLISEYKEDK